MAFRTPYVRGGVLYCGEQAIEVESEPWWSWLGGDATTFRYLDGTHSFTARREARQGQHYWYAYRKQQGRLAKRYLGRSEDLQNAQLDHIARKLSERLTLEPVAKPEKSKGGEKGTRLFEELFSQQTALVQRFLLHSAQLEHFTAPLCDAVLDIQESEAILLSLEQSNRFLLPLDESHTWYRYHKVFGDFLRARLQQTASEVVREIHLKAAGWYEQQGNLSLGMNHLLTAREFGRAGEVLERNCEPLMKQGKFLTLQHFLSELPEEVLRARPRLFLYYAVCMAITGHVKEAERYLRRAEQQLLPWLDQGDSAVQIDLPPEQVRCELSMTRASLAAYRGDVEATIRLSRQVATLLPPGNEYLRSTLFGIQATAYILSGDLAGGMKELVQAQDAGRAVEYLYLEVMGKSLRAYMLMEQGAFQQAATLCTHIIDQVRDGTTLPDPVIAMAYIVLGEIEYAWGHLQKAEPLLRRGVELSEHWSDINLRIRAYALLARLLRVQGDIDQAQQLAEKLEQLGWQTHVSRAVLYGQGLQARLLLDQGRVTQALSWAEHADPRYTQSAAYLDEPLALLSCRVLGENKLFTEALHLNGRLLVAADEAQRHKSRIDITVARIVLFCKMGAHHEVQQLVNAAIELAAPQRYLSPFLEERRVFAPILIRLSHFPEQQTSLSSVGRDFLLEIVSSLERGGGPERMLNENLALTAREQEVLHLLAQGLTNQQIAQQLFIGLNTVKWHLKNLALKLGVHTRLQIVHQAQRLHLLKP
ncbi:LuxR C-terminal-related transcriptional regulator [Dictyobacter kobayashii]|uniref:HTH luxR-type domain-containing protein n=1 Tax=Dictyobacter kobayashii TaxID=2014872 RepID=A0A402ANF4_9CHLR|nr:LuxR C-terminal-related transcriptional regulator [Dictyobacter kobayashii]GCE20677.1 hypothetical protein KDK_44770 [Dictyobacter kobayashii]